MPPHALSPAETRLSWPTLTQGLRSGLSDFPGLLQSRLHAPQLALAGSGRALLYLLFKDLRAQAGPEKTEVLIPGYTCYSVAAAAVKAGLRVALYDLDPRTFQPDVAGVERALCARTLAVVGQHLLGLPANLAPLANAAKRHNVCFVQDAAQRLVFGREGVGLAVADATMYSFGRGKPLPLGGGGALVAHNDQAAVRLDRIAAELAVLPMGPQRTLAPLLVRMLSWPWIYWLLEKLPLGLGRTIYDPGFAITAMSPAHQRIGAAALDELEQLNRHRSLISAVYARELGSPQDDGSPEAPPLVRFPVMVDNQDQAGQMLHLGVRRMYPQALCDLEALKPELAPGQATTPGAQTIARRLLTLPTHTGVDEAMAMKIAGQVRRIFGSMDLVCC